MTWISFYNKNRTILPLCPGSASSCEVGNHQPNDNEVYTTSHPDNNIYFYCKSWMSFISVKKPLVLSLVTSIQFKYVRGLIRYYKIKIYILIFCDSGWELSSIMIGIKQCTQFYTIKIFLETCSTFTQFTYCISATFDIIYKEENSKLDKFSTNINYVRRYYDFTWRKLNRVCTMRK